MEVTEFVLAELPPSPARVLEVGCGRGELARALSAAGYDILAIDPEAPRGRIFRRATIEEFAEPGPFDAVVTSRALHHVGDLAEAIEKLEALLRRGGVIVLDDFAWERLDAGSAASVGIDHDVWRDEHSDLHTSAAMLRELDRRFAQRTLAWEPYLYREARQVVDEAAERELIAMGTIEAIGFRYVGTR